MKKNIFSLFLLFATMFLFVGIQKIQAQTFYTLDEIKLHQTSDDCWMAIENKVYDLSNYLSDHDRYLDIRDWCGQDATDDYNTKAGKNKDHSVKADEMLAAYIIGELDIVPNNNELEDQNNVIVKNEAVVEANTEVEENIIVETNTEVEENNMEGDLADPSVAKNAVTSPDPKIIPKYRVLLPVLITIVLYLLTSKLLRKATHDFLWNSVMLFGLIPVVGFGFILALVDQVSFLAKINYNQMLFLHAQLSLIIGTAMILHFLKRMKIYSSQRRFTFKK